MFRIKLVKETRDGRPLKANFPSGPGGLWIHWDEAVLDSHLKHLSRPEIKEYCIVRQRQIDEGETPDERVSNETKAIFEAQQRVSNYYSGKRDDLSDALPEFPKEQSNPSVGDGPASTPLSKRDSTSQDLRHSRRSENGPGPRARHSLPDVELRAANRPRSVDALERTNVIARREIARAEAVQIRADQRQANREAATASKANNRSLFHDNRQRLNKVWEAQEANRLKAGTEDSKIYDGIKYERKHSGPFEGKLVSSGTIISIDGEDYVEYRVLTKPTFV
jgi:hypothetical protein